MANYESKALPYILANKGYDVWLGNSRGNKHSRKHVRYNADIDKEYWNFSLHEMGIYDIPAVIDFILTETGRTKLTYIGHSQGTALLFAALTIKNDYFKERLNGFLAFGPVTSLNNIKSKKLALLANLQLDVFIKSLGTVELARDNVSYTKLQAKICSQFPFICKLMLSIASGNNPENDDMDRFNVWSSHYPSGASTKSLAHFAICVRSKAFRYYDEAKLYDISNIRDIPIALFVGDLDVLATENDNVDLVRKLAEKNPVKFYKVYKNVGHITFFISKDNNHVDDALNQIAEFNK